MSAARVVIPRTSLLREVGATGDLLRKLERTALVAPVARAATEVYYAADARAQVERVRTLIAAGYAERDIAHVIGKVLDKTSERVETVQTAESLATMIPVSTERVLALETKGLLPAWAHTEAGEPLFSLEAVELVRGLAALELLGLGAHAGAWSAAHATPEEVDLGALRDELTTRLAAIERATGELQRLLGALGRREGSGGRKPRATHAGTPALAKLLPRRRVRTAQLKKPR